MENQPSQKIQKHCNFEPEDFQDRILSMLWFNDIEWTERGNSGIIFQIPNMSRLTRRDSRKDTGPFTGPGEEKKWYGTLRYTPEGTWESIATQNGSFKETGHPVCKSISALVVEF